MKLKKLLVSMLTIGALSCSMVAFAGCNKGASLTQGMILSYELSEDGAYYILTKAKNPFGADSVIIPNDYMGKSVREIGSTAFADCDNLTSVIIPDSITSIGNFAFADCDSLTSVLIPDGVTSIGSCAFWKCENLTSVMIGNSVMRIGPDAFRECGNLTSIVLPDSVKKS